jgi:dephospho-CoA kinase
MKIKLMILGYARHGKDTVAEILSQAFGLTMVSSSHAAGKKIMLPYFQSVGIHYRDFEECYQDRVNHRQEWYEQIAAYNTPDKARLAREIYAESDIYVGIRSREEFDAAKAAGLFQYSIWVDRSKHVAPEPAASNTIGKDAADYVIDNNGTLEQLKIEARSLYVNLISLEYAGHYETKEV